MNIDLIGRLAALKALRIPGFVSKVPAGFPSPAEDYMDKALDLNEHLVSHPAATFYCRVSGESMRDAGIFDGDLLIVDRAVEAAHGDVVLAAINGELTCKILDVHAQQLRASIISYAPLPVNEHSDFSVEGVVMYSIRNHHVRTC